MERLGIVLVATDVGPRKGLGALKEGLDNAGHFAAIMQDQCQIRELIGPSDLVICGMSSTEALAAMELAAIEEASSLGKPVILYADTFGVIKRPWFSETEPRMVFVVNGEEARKAADRFPMSAVVVTGNPEWEQFFQPPLAGKPARWSELGFDDRSPVLLNVWGKNPSVNIAIASALVDAIENRSAHLAVARHPGDKTPEDTYEGLVKFGSIRYVSSDILPYVDLVIESASTVGVHAACRRVPVISVFPVIAERRLSQATGLTSWPLCEEGCSVWTRPAGLLGKIDSILCDSSTIKTRQQEVFPTLQLGQAVECMIKAISRLFG